MIRVAFIVLTSDKWTGGTNYFKNLLCAVAKLKDKKIQPVLFFPSNENKEIIQSFKPFGKIVKTDILDNKTLYGFINSVLMRLFNTSFYLEDLFKRNNIQVVSHSRFIDSKHQLKTINWVVDFQHIHFPEMFSLLEGFYRNILFSRFSKYSDAVVLSSQYAKKDFIKLYKKYMAKARVLHFVSYPNSEIYNIKNTKKIEKIYKFSGKFFYLPNQLWKHKNHMVVLKAINLLKKDWKEVLVICTGYMRDYRNHSYKDNLLKYIENNKLENNVRFLGLINYKDVLTLMRHSVSIINPSLFEGWSTTVEEAKSVGKNMILSDIPVHKEQNPPESHYFKPNDEKELAKVLWKKWLKSDGGPDHALEKRARSTLEGRITKFAKEYENMVLDIIKN